MLRVGGLLNLISFPLCSRDEMTTAYYLDIMVRTHLCAYNNMYSESPVGLALCSSSILIDALQQQDAGISITWTAEPQEGDWR